MTDGLVLHQALYAAAVLSLADLLDGNARHISEVARQIAVDEHALYRLMRFLASREVFQETSPRTFANTELSCFLRSDFSGIGSSFPGLSRQRTVFRALRRHNSQHSNRPAREREAVRREHLRLPENTP
jgi:hypothetical protein